MTFLNLNLNEYSITFDILNIHSFLLIAVSACSVSSLFSLTDVTWYNE